ncbi:MAG: DUF3667 domain-containing protein [Muribaculaceae bacterium]|nr:DUF3667 domain-containing protein [Muribaculaceae bacterium]
MTDSQQSGVKICKNCGAQCSSRFCPDCGQAVSEERLKNKTFFLGLLSGFTRINRGLLYTSWHLWVHPWRVIRDYIQCRRVSYTPPVNMFVLLCFLGSVVAGLVTVDVMITAEDVDLSSLPVGYKIGYYIGQFFKNSVIAQNLTIYLPALLALPIVYCRKGAGKYNLAEYFTALLYLINAFIVFGIVTLPLKFLVTDAVYSGIELCYTVAIVAISLIKAFPMATLSAAIKYFVLFLIVSMLIYMLIFVGIGLLIMPT